MKASASNSLYRTFDPKYTTYMGDGAGRDTYISHINGGFLPGISSYKHQTSSMLP